MFLKEKKNQNGIEQMSLFRGSEFCKNPRKIKKKNQNRREPHPTGWPDWAAANTAGAPPPSGAGEVRHRGGVGATVRALPAH